MGRGTVRRGQERYGRHGQVCHGALWLGAVGRVRDKNSLGMAGEARQGTVWRGEVLYGVAWFGTAGRVWCVTLCFGKVGRGLGTAVEAKKVKSNLGNTVYIKSYLMYNRDSEGGDIYWREEHLSHGGLTQTLHKKMWRTEWA